MKRASGRGLMALTHLSLSEATRLAAEYDGRFSVAASNSPGTTVISGDADAVEQALAKLESREIFCRRIKVDVASHCAHMEPFREELAQPLERHSAAGRHDSVVFDHHGRPRERRRPQCGLLGSQSPPTRPLLEGRGAAVG